MASPLETARTLRAMIDPEEITYLPELRGQAVASWADIPDCWLKDEVLISLILHCPSPIEGMLAEYLKKRLPEPAFRAALLYEMSRSKATHDRIYEVILRPNFGRFGNPFGEAGLPLLDRIDRGERIAWLEVKTALGFTDYPSVPQDDDHLLLLRSLYQPRTADRRSLIEDILAQRGLIQQFPFLGRTIFEAAVVDSSLFDLAAAQIDHLLAGAIEYLDQVNYYRADRVALAGRLIPLIRPHLGKLTVEARTAILKRRQTVTVCLLPELADGVTDIPVVTAALEELDKGLDNDRGNYERRNALEPLVDHQSLERILEKLAFEHRAAYWLSQWNQYSGIDPIVSRALLAQPAVFRDLYQPTVRDGRAASWHLARYLQAVEPLSIEEAKSDLLAWLKNSGRDSWPSEIALAEKGQSASVFIAQEIVRYDIRLGQHLRRPQVRALTTAGYHFSDRELSREIVPFGKDRDRFYQPHEWEYWRREPTEINRLLHYCRETEALVASYVMNGGDSRPDVAAAFDQWADARPELQQAIINLAFREPKITWDFNIQGKLETWARKFLQADSKRLAWLRAAAANFRDLENQEIMAMFLDWRPLLDQLMSPADQLTFLLTHPLDDLKLVYLPILLELADDVAVLCERLTTKIIVELKFVGGFVWQTREMLAWIEAILRLEPNNPPLRAIVRDNITSTDASIAKTAFLLYWQLKTLGHLAPGEPAVV